MARPRKDAGAVPMDRRILNEFSQLLLEKPLAELTVAALCSKACCNKTTFYYHYATFADLVARYLEELDADAVLECALSALLGSGERAAASVELASLSGKYDELCTLVAKNPQGPIQEHVEAVVRRHAAAFLGVGEQPPTPRQEMLASFTAGGVMRLLAYRGNAGSAIGFEELVEVFYPEVFPAIVRAAKAED